jgi:hypothetical protein
MIKTLVFLVTFALLASPAYFRALRSVLGGSVASPDGLARPAGLFIAGLVFIVALYLESRATSGFKRFNRWRGRISNEPRRVGKGLGMVGVAPGTTAVGAAAIAEGAPADEGAPAAEGAPADEGADEGPAEEFLSY